MIPSTPAEWRQCLGFVPDPASIEGATYEKVGFLRKVIQSNPLVTISAMQRFLQGQFDCPIIDLLRPSAISWLAKELGDQLLTLCLKEVRESTAVFAAYALNQIENLSLISIKGKKKRFRDWRDVVFTTVLQTPEVEYATPSVALPHGYKSIRTNHELLVEASRFGNCSFQFFDSPKMLSGEDSILVGELDGEPVMIHYSLNRIKEVKFAENRSLTPAQLNKVVIDFTYKMESKLPVPEIPVANNGGFADVW